MGTVEFIHPRYGVFVKLGAAQSVSKDETLTILRDGRVTVVLKVDRITKPETLYPHGCAVCTATHGNPSKGNEVRRAKR